MGFNKYFLCDFLFVPLNFFFFQHCQNTVEDEEKGWVGSGGLPQKKMSKTGSFSRKNTPFDT